MYGGGVEYLAKMGEFWNLNFEHGMWGVVIGGGSALAARNHRRALNNLYGQFQAGYSEAEDLISP